MPRYNEFVEHLLELLEPLGPVHARPMFGGYGIFVGDCMVGLVAEETFYLKADEKNRPDFERFHLGAFTYEKNGKNCSMSYYEAPPESLDDSRLLCQWADRSLRAARRARKNRK